MTDELKQRAAQRAVELIEDGARLGLGTGSTARFVLQEIAARRKRGELTRIVGVPTSTSTRQLAMQLAIPLSTLDDTPELDLAIDGADEVDPELNLIKGLGGALLWEKIVASAAERFVVVIDDTKFVERLGDRAPVPIEVVRFGWTTHFRFLEELGGKPSLRKNDKDEPFATDSGNYIIDCEFADGITDAWRLETELKHRAGIVETGLFLDMAQLVVVATKAGVNVLQRGPEP
jgi:ribose 5-phosphate isomerase A